MQTDDYVKVYGEDEIGRTLDGMTGKVLSLSPFYAHVALVAWGGEIVRVERIRLVPHDARPKSAAQVRRELRDDWAGRNARMMARMTARRAA